MAILENLQLDSDRLITKFEYFEKKIHDMESDIEDLQEKLSKQINGKN